MKDESDFPRLTPPDDKYPAHDGLLRKPEELTDEQFDLLAAAWSEEALAGDQLSELEEAMTAKSSRRIRAESFREVKLAPYDDKWAGRNRLLRQPPATRVIKRTLIVTVLAAAAVVAFIISGPAIRNRTTDIPPGVLPEAIVISEALIPVANPIIIPESVVVEPAAVSHATETDRLAVTLTATVTESARTSSTGDITDTRMALASGVMTDPAKAAPAAGTAEPQRALPVSLAINAVNPVMIAAARTTDLRAVEMNPATIVPQQAAVSVEMPTAGKESNWIFRGVSALAKAITKEEKKIDGYFVASACVKGLNNALGWEMELEQAGNKAGVPVAVNFSSSLLSFSAPVNKNSP